MTTTPFITDEIIEACTVTRDGAPSYVDIDDLNLSAEQREHLGKWFYGKTLPLISPKKFTVYPWDLEKWVWCWRQRG